MKIKLATIGVLVILQVTAWAGTEKVLWSFGGSGDGRAPTGNLIVDASGNFYGATLLGGAHDRGTVFELSPNGNGGWTETVLYSFGSQNGDGTQPSSGLVMDSKGNLYGTTEFDGATQAGTVFELSPASGGGWTETVIYTFGPPGKGDGYYPASDLALDAQGNLYGTTFSGGTVGEGTLYQLSPSSSGWTETVLHSFPSSQQDGFNPRTGVLLGKVQTHLYGSTSSGVEDGTVYRLWFINGNWVEKTIHDFDFSNNGGSQTGGDLVMDHRLNIYGASNNAGANGTGTVWQMVYHPLKVRSFRLLYSFGADGSGDGTHPQSGVIVGSNGTVYGTTGFGGIHDGGIVFALTKSQNNQWRETILYSFTGGGDGSAPVGQLIQDKQGNLYGVGLEGGTHGGGVVFEVTP
jgi:uncharacterized repeat protein (TIGR03803 family)